MADGTRAARVLVALTCLGLCLAATITVGPPDPVGAWRFLTAPDATPGADVSVASLLCWSALMTASALVLRPFVRGRRQRRSLTGAGAVAIAAAGLIVLGAGVAHHLVPASRMCCSGAWSLVEARHLNGG